MKKFLDFYKDKNSQIDENSFLEIKLEDNKNKLAENSSNDSLLSIKTNNILPNEENYILKQNYEKLFKKYKNLKKINAILKIELEGKIIELKKYEKEFNINISSENFELMEGKIKKVHSNQLLKELTRTESNFEKRFEKPINISLTYTPQNKSTTCQMANEEFYKKKIRELNREVQMIKIFNNEEKQRNFSDIKIIQQELQLRNESFDNMMSYIKTVEESRDQLQIQFIKKNNAIKNIQGNNENSEFKIFHFKKQIANIINIIFEFGNVNLMEKIEKIVLE